jgi:hypothetical protein
MRRMTTAILMVAAALAAMGSANSTPSRKHLMMIPRGTDVVLVFDAPLNSKFARVGDEVPLDVRDGIVMDGVTVLAAGTPVTGRIEEVSGHRAFGINAKMRIAINPVETRYGRTLLLEPRQEGKVVGRRTGDAAAISGGGMILFGPVGLLGGLFVHGKPAVVHTGDELVTQIAHNTLIGL